MSSTGNPGYKVKTYQSVNVYCESIDTTRGVDVDFLRGVSRFEFVGDFQRCDGVFERLVFDNINPIDIDLTGNWVFDVEGPANLARKLIDKF